MANAIHTRNLLTPAECLLRALTPTKTNTISIRISRPSYYRTAYTSTAQTPQQPIPSPSRFNPRYRTVRQDEPSQAQRTPPTPVPSTPPQESGKLAELTTDENIATRYVRVKAEDNTLGEPESLRNLLASLDREKQIIVQVALPPPSTPSNESGNSSNATTSPNSPKQVSEQQYAIVSIQERTTLLARLRAREDLVKANARTQRHSKPKTLEINWAIDNNDLAQKMKKLEEFVAKGKKTEIMLAARRRQRRATLEESRATLETVLARIEELGGRLEKAQEGEVGKQVTLIVVKK